MEKTNDVIGLGNAMMDFLVEVDENKLLEFNLNKGEMHLIEEDRAKEILKKINEYQLKIEIAPGGSAANTLRGVAFLGGKAILCGKVGADPHGEVYVQEMNNLGVSARINKHYKTTGHCISFITPDFERTMSTHLGAALELYKEDILEEDIAMSKVLHLEGYQLEGQTREVVLHAIELAKKHNILISIDLADSGVIRRNKEFLKEFVKQHIDIVFLNEKEAEEFTGLDNEEAAARELGNYIKIAVVKVGERGSYIAHQNQITKIPAFLAQVIDTTGAGDSYAAGFLYGYCNNWNMEESGKLGSLLASKVVEQKGVGMKDIDCNKLKAKAKEGTMNDDIDVDKADVNNDHILEEKKGNNQENKGQQTVTEQEKSIKIGIIGGSGLDDPQILQDTQDLDVNTPYGKPSSLLKVGKINNINVILIARHGRQHTIPPTQVNNRANIHALKEQGCTHILATTACGSLRQEIERGDFVILDQFIDFTRLRRLSFHDSFAPGEMAHTPMAEPFDQKLRKKLLKTCQELNLKHHQKGTVVTIEGPRFSTKAESHMFRFWGADVINMSIAPEAILAKEANIPYAAVAMSTDYDCWKEDEEPVTWEAILEVFKQNVEKVTNLLINTIPKISRCCSECNSDRNELNNVKLTKNISNNELEKNIKMKNENKKFDLKSTIRTVPHWPKQGVMFRDITTLLENPEAFSYTIKKFAERYKNKNITKIVGIESRGFIFGAALAKELHLPFVLMRKPGKLPAETISQEYQLEYGTDTIEIHKDSIKHGDNVLLVDDLLATGGTMKAACRLVEKLYGNVSSIALVIDLPDLKGRDKLKGYDVFHLVEFEGE